MPANHGPPVAHGDRGPQGRAAGLVDGFFGAECPKTLEEVATRKSKGLVTLDEIRACCALIARAVKALQDQTACVRSDVHATAGHRFEGRQDRMSYVSASSAVFSVLRAAPTRWWTAAQLEDEVRGRDDLVRPPTRQTIEQALRRYVEKQWVELREVPVQERTPSPRGGMGARLLYRFKGDGSGSGR